MRKWQVENFDQENPQTLIVDEEQILKEYWDYWYEQMCKKFGKEIVDEKYTNEDCLLDWETVNWAWRVE